MKRHFITIIIALAAVSAYAQQDNYTISGDLSPMVGILVKDTTDIDSVFVVNDANHRAGIEQKCAVEDGKFFLTGHVDKPQYTEMKITWLGTEKMDTAYLEFILEAGCDIVYKNGLVKGSPMTDMYLKQRGEIWNLANNGKDDEARSLYLEQIREHRDDALGVAFMRMLRPAWLTVTSEKKLIESLGDEVKYDFRIQRRLNHLRSTTERPRDSATTWGVASTSLLTSGLHGVAPADRRFPTLSPPTTSTMTVAYRWSASPLGTNPKLL